MNAHSIIASPLEYELFDCGVTADDEVAAILERVRKVIAPQMPRFEYELKTADIKRDAEQVLAQYVVLNVNMTTDAIVDALYETNQQTNQTTKEQ